MSMRMLQRTRTSKHVLFSKVLAFLRLADPMKNPKQALLPSSVKDISFLNILFCLPIGIQSGRGTAWYPSLAGCE